MPRRLAMVTLVAMACALGPMVGVAQGETKTIIDLRVWQHTEDTSNIYISARPDGGSWGTLGTIPLPLDDGFSRSGRWRYGDIAVDVPLATALVATVEVRVWQGVEDGTVIQISARPAGGDWNVLPTQPLALDGISRSGSYRYGDATLAVPLPERFDVPVPTAAIEFDGDFNAAERVRLEAQFEGEFSRVATFFARTYGVTATGLTIVMERPGDGASFGDDVIWLSDGFERAIAHEYVHALQAQLPDRFPEGGEPAWISEGVATYFELRYDEAVQNRTFQEGRRS